MSKFNQDLPAGTPSLLTGDLAPTAMIAADWLQHVHGMTYLEVIQHGDLIQEEIAAIRDFHSPTYTGGRWSPLLKSVRDRTGMHLVCAASTLYAVLIIHRAIGSDPLAFFKSQLEALATLASQHGVHISAVTTANIPKQEMDEHGNHRLVAADGRKTPWAHYTAVAYLDGHVSHTAYYARKEGVLPSAQFVELIAVKA